MQSHQAGPRTWYGPVKPEPPDETGRRRLVKPVSDSWTPFFVIGLAGIGGDSTPIGTCGAMARLRGAVCDWLRDISRIRET